MKAKTKIKWKDSLLRCPSQCEADLGNGVVLYLRWRYGDPWTADLIFNDDEWVELDIPFFTEDQLDRCKKAAISIAENYLKESYENLFN